MAGAYEIGRVERLRGNVDFVNASVGALLVSSAYVPNEASDQTIEDVPAASVIATTSLTGRYIDEETIAFKADPAVFASVSGDVAGAVLVLFVDKPSYSDCILLFYFDAFTVTPDGTDIVFNWPAEGIFRA